jgi:hypothetical protein
MRNPFKRPIKLRIFLRSGQSFDIKVEDWSMKLDEDALSSWTFTWWNTKHNKIIACSPRNIVAVVKL